MPYEFQGTVTQKSNGTIVITPAQDSKRLPAMGDTVTVTIAVTEPVDAAATKRTLTDPLAGGPPSPKKK